MSRMISLKLTFAGPARTVFTDDDCYFSEFSAIIDVIDGKADRAAILSTFQDAADTYKLVRCQTTPKSFR